MTEDYGGYSFVPIAV